MSTANHVLIQGEGMAAVCCSHLLTQGGVSVSRDVAGRAQLPVIMLAESALELIRDVFGDTGLLRDLPRIRKRFVLWGDDAKPAELEHSAGVVSEAGLLKALGSTLPSGAPEAEITESYRVLAARPLLDGVMEHRFGSRMASAVQVDLRPAAEPETCWIESVESGWLFLISAGVGAAWLLCVGGAPDEMLGSSRLVALQVAGHGEATRQFPASPRMISPVCATGWLACGTAAMAFDPICGDGTAHAVREAVLASALIRGVLAGGDEATLLQHYSDRLLAGFRKHLELCLRFYESGSASDWWRNEAEAVRAGMVWCDNQPKARARYRLIGFDLHPIP